MGLFVHFTTPLLCTILFRHLWKRPAGFFLLEGLDTYLPHTATLPAPPPGSKISKRERKLLQKRHLQGLQGGGAGGSGGNGNGGSSSTGLVQQQLGPSALSHLYGEAATFGQSFESLGVLLCTMAVGCAVHATMGPLLGLWQDLFLWTLCPLVATWAAGQLLLLECGGGGLGRALASPAARRLAFIGSAGAAFAYIALTEGGRRGWVRWDVGRGAAEGFNQLVNGGMARLVATRMRGAAPPPPIAAGTEAVARGLALAAGVLTAALVAPAARAAKLYSYISPVPSWARNYLTPHPAAAAAIRLALLAPLPLLLYGIPPMAAFWREIAAAWRLPLPAAHAAALAAAAGPALAAAVGLLRLCSLRSLAGVHLGGALLEWHLLRYDTGAGVRPEVRDGVIKKRLTFVFATVCQVALQLLASAAIPLALALMYAASSGALDPLRPSRPLLWDANVALARAPPLAPPAPPVEAPAPTQPPPTQGSLDLLAGAADALEGLVEDPVAGAVAAAAAASGFAPVVSDVSGGGLPPLPPLDFVAFATGFLSWWCAAVGVLVTYPLMLVYRTGLHLG